jgi:hypothetical protein
VLNGGPIGSLDAVPAVQLANFFAGSDASRKGVRVGVIPTGTGTAAVVTADVAVNTVQVYNLDGTVSKTLAAPGGSKGVFFSGQAFDWTTYSGGRPPSGGLNQGGQSTGPTGPSGTLLGNGDGPTGEGGNNTGGSTNNPGAFVPTDTYLRSVSSSYSSPLAQLSDPLTNVFWLFTDNGVFGVYSADTTLLCLGLWARNGDGSIRFDSFNTTATQSNTANFSNGLVRRNSNGTFAMTGEFVYSASQFSLGGTTFGTYSSALVRL